MYDIYCPILKQEKEIYHVYNELTIPLRQNHNTIARKVVKILKQLLIECIENHTHIHTHILTTHSQY